MEAKNELLSYKKILDKRLGAYFAKKLREMKKWSPSARDAAKSIRDMTLAGGKRLRAGFMYWGYRAAGGREASKIIEASMSIELTHIFLLIHDDVIDRDDFRHGIRAIHKKYENLARRYYRKIEPVHFGNSMAIIVGDMAAAFGNEIIFNSAFPSDNVRKALTKLQEIVRFTVSGEILDIVLEARGTASEKEILNVHENKTAKYTVEGPLHLGALLAGANGGQLKALSSYAVPVGIAFQIQDDILGMFGDEKKLGKPVCSDLRDGKQTLLVAKALEFGSRADRNNIKKLLGKRDVSRGEIEFFRNVVRNTGSLAYSQRLAENLVERGKREILSSGLEKSSKEFLAGIADYIVKREI